MIDHVKFTSEKREVKNALFSILIPSWNNLEYLKLCIKSIEQNSSFTHEIIVHINEGSDGTLAWIQSRKIYLITHTSENVGVCYALNYCSTLASTEYILYMNDDMYACPLWDKYLYEEIKKIGHNNFFLSATALNQKHKANVQLKKITDLPLMNLMKKNYWQEFETLPIEDWYGATWPPNIVHKSIWELAGKYSIEFSPGMYSDPDFSMKLWQMGIRIFKGVAKSRVYHFGSFQ